MIWSKMLRRIRWSGVLALGATVLFLSVSCASPDSGTPNDNSSSQEADPEPVLQVQYTGGMPTPPWVNPTHTTVIMWGDGRVVFREAGVYREGRIDEDTVKLLLGAAWRDLRDFSECLAFDAAPTGYDIPSYALTISLPEGAKTAVTRGMGGQYMAPDSELVPVADRLASLHQAIQEALPKDAPALELDAVVVDIRPVTAQATGGRGQLQEWPDGLEGRLTGEDAVRARGLLRGGTYRDYFLRDGDVHYVNVQPDLPDIRDPDCDVPVADGSEEESTAPPALSTFESTGALTPGALFSGELVVDGRCLYLFDHEFGEKWLPIFVEGSVSWEADALVLGGQRIEIGENVTVGGGEAKDLSNVPLLREPDDSCDTQNVWRAWPLS